MSQSVKLSDGLVLDARLTGKEAGRSVAGQIEFWAKLGRAIDSLLQRMQALPLTRAGEAAPLSGLFSSMDAEEGKTRLAGHLHSLPFPHYEPSGKPGLLIRIDASGKRTLGRFVRREFKAVKTRSLGGK